MNSRHTAAALLLAAVVSLGQTPSSEVAPELLTLARIKVRMAEVVKRQPNYVCLEQVERSRRTGPKHRYELIDVVRLEVAYVDGKELFAWPGSNKFETSEFEKLVPAGGAFGNGTFALLVNAVFLSNGPVFEYKGAADLNGKKTDRYDFRVAQMNSGYQLKTNLASAVVAFHGSFWADAASRDVLRLEVYADDIPPAVGLDQSWNKIEYARIKLGESDFLLPAASELSMIGLKGDENRNRTRFSGCRQYTGESVVTFSEAPLDAAAPEAVKPEKQRIEIPIGYWFDVELETEVDSQKSAVGDLVTGKLTDNLKYKRKTLFPQKSIVRGNIVRLERSGDFIAIEIRFSEIESATARAVIQTRIDDQRLTNAKSRTLATGLILVPGGRAHLSKGYRVPVSVVAAPATPGQ